jgi:CRP/FNR family transcriptional regulator
VDSTSLAQVPFFAALSEGELAHLSNILVERELLAGEVLFYENEVDQRVFILLAGQIEVIKALDTPGERLLGVREAGAVFGEMSLFNPEQRRSATLRARTRLRLLEIDQDEFKELLLHHPSLALEMLRTMSLRLNSSKSPPSRIF